PVARPAGVRAYFRAESAFERWRYLVLLSWLFVPIAAAFVFSLRTPLMLDRYFIVCLPPLLLLAALGANQIRPAWLQAACVAVLMVLTARVIVWNDSHLQK